MGEVLLWAIAPALAFSAAALTWHVIAWRELRRMVTHPISISSTPTSPSLTLFKSLPGPADEQACRAIASFLTLLRPGDSLCLGFPADAPPPPLPLWQTQFPRIRIIPVPLTPNPAIRNPKIRHLYQMAAYAPEGLWLWSDADMEAPPGFLDALRTAWAVRGHARLLVAPYHINNLRTPAALLDASIAHLQVIPGLLYLAQRGAIDFAVGSAALFDSADFRRSVNWDELGAALADDHLLGKRMAPVRVVPLPASTPAVTNSLSAAWRHALRWQRTIHSCNPLASLAHGAVLPLLAWIGTLAAAPCLPTACGLILWWLWECVWTVRCHRTVGGHFSSVSLATVPLAVLARNALWLIAWLPGTIQWSGSIWPLSWQRNGPALRLLPSLLPWAVWFAATPLPYGLRALVALVTWWVTHARWTASLKPVDAVFGLHFALQTIVALPSGVAVNGLLFLMAAISLLFQAPFTLAYAREQVACERWNHPLFLQANRVLTLLWTAAFFFNTVWFGIDPSPTPPWNWLLPATACAAAGLCTLCLPQLYAKKMEQSSAA